MTSLAALWLGAWLSVRDGDPSLVDIYRRHYSANPATSRESQLRHGVSGVGQSICLVTWQSDAGFIWVRNTTARYDKQVGVQCSFFRNESDKLSSALIREADSIAWERWPGERHWTYVSPTQTRRKRDPGRCFRKAGWTPCGESKGGLLILERMP